MNKLYNPCIFQGKKQLKTNKEYFEGWYFKNTNLEDTISFIPGIAIHSEKKEAFIQIITQDDSWYIPYPISEFSYHDNPFFIKIGENYFSNNTIKLKINHKQISINGILHFQNETPIHHHLLSPNIMGTFSFVPKMECNHAIVSMKHSIDGSIHINDKTLLFENGIGYIEKDWGNSFPSQYIWGQANCFSNNSTSLFFAVATIPFHSFHFEGFICNFILEGKEYRFATYNGSNILSKELDEKNMHVVFRKKHLTLEIIAKSNHTKTLKAPEKGKMQNHIQESIQAEIEVTLKQKNTILFKEKSNCAGLELIT